MPKQRTVRFAVGTPTAPFSGVWRVVANKDDVYIGPTRAMMAIAKLSLHKSGVWAYSATQQSGATFQDGNRRAKQWRRPPEHCPGVTRGPSILVPHTSLGSRPMLPDEPSGGVIWHNPPARGELVHFSLYFVKPDTPTKWASHEVELAALPLRSGERIVLLGSTEPAPSDFMETVERLLRENVFGISDMSGYYGGSFLWATESRDHLKIPIFTDIPVPLKETGPEDGST